MIPVGDTELLPREIKLIDTIVKSVQSDSPKSIKQCLMDSGYPESTADKQAKAVIGKDRVKSALIQAMERIGITPDKLSNVLKNGLEAKKIWGTQDDFIEVDDHPTRHKYLETALKLRGDYQDQTQVNTQVNIAVEMVEYSKPNE